MKKIIILATIFIFSFKMNGQELDKLYANAKLNIDYSSSILLTDKEILLENELSEWILYNRSNFENINEIKIAFENKWYWGSWKKVVRGLEFVKKENTQNRIAYFEDLRKRNETECRRQQERSQMLWTLGTAAVIGAGAYAYNHRVEIRDFFVDALKNPSSDTNNSSNNNNSSNINSSNQTNNKNLDGNQKLKNSESPTIDKEKYRTGNFELPNYTEEVAYSEKYVKKIFIKFNDDISFAIYYSPECGKYYHNETIGIKSYFKDKTSLIKSMYAYKTGGFNSIYNFGNSSTCD